MSRPKEELPVRSTTQTNLYFVTVSIPSLVRPIQTRQEPSTWSSLQFQLCSWKDIHSSLVYKKRRRKKSIDDVRRFYTLLSKYAKSSPIGAGLCNKNIMTFDLWSFFPYFTCVQCWKWKKCLNRNKNPIKGVKIGCSCTLVPPLSSQRYQLDFKVIKSNTISSNHFKSRNTVIIMGLKF